MQENHINLFTEQLHIYTLNQFVPFSNQLANEIRASDLRSSHTREDGQRVQVGGRQTDPVLLDKTTAPFPQLKKIWHSIIEKLDGHTVLESEAWGVLMDKKDGELFDSIIEVPHYHLPWQWSGVYYVKVPKEIGTGYGGAIKFLNPNPFRQKEAQRVYPEEGMLLVFPSYMLHSIEHMDCEGERVSIALNALCSTA